MGYRNVEDGRAYQREYYRCNSTRILERDKAYRISYRQSPQGRATQLAKTYRMQEKWPDKYKARYTLRNAVASGFIEKQPCEMCGVEKSEGHHDNYSKPLEVRWLCNQHHCELEGR